MYLKNKKKSTLNLRNFLKKILQNFWSQTMLLAMRNILTSLGEIIWAFFSYLLFRFEIALLRHHVTNFEKIFDTIQDFLISPILKKSLAKSVEAILRYQLNKPQGGVRNSSEIWQFLPNGIYSL